MKSSTILVVIASLAGAAYIIYRIGFAPVVAAVLSVRWAGFLLLLVYGVATIMLLGLAWLALVPPFSWRSAITFCWSRAVRDSAGEVLPFSQIGGLVIGVRAAIVRGVSSGVAFASTVVDVTVEMIAQIAFIILGLIIFVVRLRAPALDVTIVETTLIGIVVAVALAGAIAVLQRRSLSLFERLAKRFLPSAAASAAAIDDAIGRIHADRSRLALAFVLHLAAWLASAFGLWLALVLIHAPLSFVDTLAVESVLSAARSAAIFVPAAIGVQEAGYALLMPVFGLAPEVGIAVSLLKRAREIAIAVPVLVSWQIAEGNRATTGKAPETLVDSQ
jgi:putative membrane protein